MFYEFDQNNSGGSFIVDDNVCHRLFIEANSEEEAIAKAEDLGCYWNGVTDGIDCPCCGDRWTPYADEINLLEFATNGYSVSASSEDRDSAIAEWNKRYGKFQVVSAPALENKIFYRSVYATGSICFADIEEYAQFLADEYGWTTPDARIYYANGKVTEIHSSKKSRN